MIVVGFVSSFAQGNGADNRPAFADEKDMPIGIRESRAKMLIEQEKKEHDEMLKRGEEVGRLSERLVRSFELTGTLSDDDRSLLESLEKNVRKIRDELGGDGDGEEIDDVLGPDKKPSLENAA